MRFEDGTVMRLYRQTIENFGLYSGAELNEEERKALLAAAGEMSAKMRAVRIVAASSVSKSDLELRLIRKGEDEDHARAAVEWMQDMHLVDDRKTAEQIVARCIAKGYGLNRAKQALYEKRIPKSYWDSVLADYPDQEYAISAFLQSRLHGEWNEKDLRKAIDALLRRGHSYGMIRSCLSQMALDTEDIPED